jgi:hypothetical protein
MKRVQVLHFLTARNLHLFQCMHGRATRLWRQVTWSGYVAQVASRGGFGLDVLQGSGSRLVYEALLGGWGDRSLGVVT